MDWRYWTIIGAAWMVGAFGSGAALAWFYKRLHPSLAFYKLWAFWTMVIAGVVTLLIALV